MNSKKEQADSKELRAPHGSDSVMEGSPLEWRQIVTELADLEALLRSRKPLDNIAAKGIDFRGNTFQTSCDFSGLTFLGDVSFARATFDGDTIFSRVTFDGHSDFSNTQWRGAARFPEARFLGPVTFKEARFRKEAKFGKARFAGTADFESARFEGETYFGYASFEEVDFSYARFLDRVFFDAGPDEPRIFSANHEIRFVSVVFEKPDDAIFRSANLHKARFANTDLSRVTFSDVAWPTLPGTVGRRKALFDEIDLRPNDNLRWIEKTYRDLRRNYEEKGSYSDAGDFYFGEMELRRRAAPAFQRVVSLVNLYRVLTGYGENYQRALAVLFLTIAAFAGAYMFAGISSEGAPKISIDYSLGVAPAAPLDAVLPDARRAFLHSLEIATFQRPRRFNPINDNGAFLQILETVLVPIQGALAALAIRRRFKR